MIAAISPAQLKSRSICYSPRTDNNVVRGTYFYRCLYSQEAAMTTGVFIVIPFRNANVVASGKGFVSFSIRENADCIKTICDIEKTLLDRLGLTSTQRVESLSSAARSGIIRNVVLPNQTSLVGPTTMILRVSGIWEDDAGHGLVYRFIVPSHPL